MDQRWFHTVIAACHTEMTKKLQADDGGPISRCCLLMLHFYKYMPQIVVSKSCFAYQARVAPWL